MWEYRTYIEPSGDLDFRYAPAPHHDVLIQALHALERGDTRRLLVMMPPGSAKSTYCSVQFATWYFARHPENSILACSNTTDLAENFNRRRRSVCLSQQWQTLAETSLNKNSQGVGRFETLEGGSIHAAGVGSSIVGLRADLLILDDPIQSFEQAMSNTQLDKIWAWYETDARSRLLPDGKELIVTTRWARNDPAGRILDLVASGEEEWSIVRLPMLCDDPLNDPLGREFDQDLWPEWFGQHQIDQNIRNPLRWSALYQQVPLDDAGSWVDAEHIHYVDESEIPEELNKIIAMDLALSTGKGDFTVFVVAGLDAARNLYILDVLRRQYTPDNAVYALFGLYEQYEPSAVLIDDDPAAKVFHRLFLDIARKRDQPISFNPMPLRGKDKETRAAAVRGLFLQNGVFIKRGNWNSELQGEIHSFPNGEHDDQIDCLSLIGRRVPEMWAPRPKFASDVPALKQVVFQDNDGQLRIDKTLENLFDARERERGHFNGRLTKRI